MVYFLPVLLSLQAIYTSITLTGVNEKLILVDKKKHI